MTPTLRNLISNISICACTAISMVSCKTSESDSSVEAAKANSSKPGSKKSANGFALASNGKQVQCFGPDNSDVVLNAARTSLKFTIEGESSGAQKITKRDTDGDTFVSYTTKDGTLRLDDQGNKYYYYNDNSDAWEMNCK